MKTKAIIFDKDGTLLDFDDFWLPISEGAIREILKKIKREDVSVENILSAMGVKAGVTDITSALCCGTYEQMGQDMYHALVNEGCNVTVDEVIKLTVDAYHGNVQKGIMRPACDHLQEVLQTLKDSGLTLAVVTTDDLFMAQKCLQMLEISSFFDAVYVDDGVTPTKPDPYCINDICRRRGISKAEVVMVGDTLTDTRFAKNGGIRVIGVAKSERNKCIIEKEADAVIPDISHLLEVLE